jgi:cell division protease FtsH
MIFIDEIDAVGYSRKYSTGGGSIGGNREAETTLNQLLNEMDGFEENEGILVIAATNLINNLDQALVRAGRFDHKIEIKLPTAPERAQIIKIHLKNKKHNLE